ncbi:hypothetical protein D6D15_04640 [Aureobasidium pullulans]|uniref:Uncharacterized protein n=1 Tax=Aureobasidium pullulans TaxID=5580 RepID=A0A4V4IVQ4_AURPU|nr:hypothetical protein D6D15_04640 [Aureobasidium pullulans]
MSKQSSQRLPAPSLFVGPPSHNASSASLTRANTDTSQTSKPAEHEINYPAKTHATNYHAQIQIYPYEEEMEEKQHKTTNKKKEPQDQWVELARAWGQTDAADSDITETKDKRNSKESKKEKDNTDGKSNPPQNKHDKNEKEMSEQAQRKLSTTTLDLTSAAKRRETSDKYFAAVKSGVAEVVRKLDGVADAMREVEMQSRDIWGDGDGKGSDGSSGFGSLSS